MRSERWKTYLESNHVRYLILLAHLSIGDHLERTKDQWSSDRDWRMAETCLTYMSSRLQILGVLDISSTPERILNIERLYLMQQLVANSMS